MSDQITAPDIEKTPHLEFMAMPDKEFAAHLCAWNSCLTHERPDHRFPNMQDMHKRYIGRMLVERSKRVSVGAA